MITVLAVASCCMQVVKKKIFVIFHWKKQKKALIVISWRVYNHESPHTEMCVRNAFIQKEKTDSHNNLKRSTRNPRTTTPIHTIYVSILVAHSFVHLRHIRTIAQTHKYLNATLASNRTHSFFNIIDFGVVELFFFKQDAGVSNNKNKIS